MGCRWPVRAGTGFSPRPVSPHISYSLPTPEPAWRSLPKIAGALTARYSAASRGGWLSTLHPCHFAGISRYAELLSLEIAGRLVKRRNP